MKKAVDAAPDRSPDYIFDDTLREAEVARIVQAQLDEARRAAEAGDDAAILDGIAICAQHELPIPAWLAKRYLAEYRKVRQYTADSWNDVFGRSMKGRKRSRLAQERSLRFVIVARVRDLRAARPRPKDIFQVVADEQRITRATCKRYWDNANRLTKRSSY